MIIHIVLHIYMRRLSNRNHDPNEHLPALYDNADGGIPKDKNIEQNSISRTVQLLPWGSTSYHTRALEENIGHEIRQRRFLHPTRYSPTITIDHGARSIKDVFRHESSSSVYTTSIVTTSSLLSSSTVTTSSRSSSPIVSSFSRLPPVLCHSSFFTVTPDVICSLNKRKRSAHNRPDKITSSASASNRKSTIGGTSTKYGVPYRNEARMLPLVTDTTSRLSLSSSGSTSSLLSLSIISQEDYTAPSVDDVMAFDSLYSETEANEDPFEDDSYHLELLFPSSDDSLYSTIQENDIPRNNGAYAIDLPLEFDNFCTPSPPTSGSTSSMLSLSIISQEDYTAPSVDDVAFDSIYSETEANEDPFEDDSYHLELLFPSSDDSLYSTIQENDIPRNNIAYAIDLPLDFDNFCTPSPPTSGSTSSLLSLSIISQEDYTAPSVDDVAFDSIYSETEANEDPFEDDSYHLELLFPSSDDSLYSTIQENDIPRNNGAYAIDLPLEFDNFCTLSPPSSDSSSSLVSPSDSSSLLTQEDYVDPFADDIFASDRSNTQSQADESSLFDFEASWDSETDEDEVSHYGNPYHLELPFANSFGSAEFTQVCDIPFGFENISTISSLSSSSSDITSSLAFSSSNSSISSEDDVIDDVNNDDILMSSGGSTYQPTEYSSFEYSTGLTTDEDEDPFNDDSYHLDLLFPSCDGSLDSAVIQAYDVPNRNRACTLELPLATDYIIRPLRHNHIVETANRSNDLRTEISEQFTGTGSLPTRLLYQELLFSSFDGSLDSTVIQANDVPNRNRACTLELPLATDYIIPPLRHNHIVETVNRSNDLRTEITEQLTGTGSLPNGLLYPNLEETLFFLTLNLIQNRLFN
ncbi:uncharacterized protein [Apostichopus japonicus]|uniref:uncharacterized protein n=1 Tax=Stichopus japonicus TaxID=307972 RepID=UPI003AB6233F